MSNENAPPESGGGPASFAAKGNAEDRPGILIVVSAPSGAGKSSLIKIVLSRVEGLGFSVSYTTRAPRGAEQEGVEYHFVTSEKFIAMRDRGEFLEWAEVHGHLYGTHIDSVQALLRSGQDVVFDVDIEGAEQISSRMPGAVTVFVLPPSPAELEARLSGRNLNPRDDMEFRLANAAREVRMSERFDYIVVNDDLEQAAKALEAIVVAERHRAVRAGGQVRAIIDTFGRGLPNA